MLILDSSNFSTENSSGYSLIDFWSPSCRPCIALAPIFSEVSQEFENVKFGKVNCDSNIDLVMEYNVSALPTVVLLKDGKEVSRFLGLKSADFIRTFLKDKIN